MQFLSSLANPVTQALGWALLHSCWQAFIVFICLRLVLLLSKNTPARLRYNFSAGALLIIFAWFVFTFFHQLQIQEQLQEVFPAMAAAFSPHELIQMQYAVHQDNGLELVMPQMESYFPLIVGLYLAGIGLCCLRIIRDYKGLSIRTKGLVMFDPAWEHHLAKLVKQLSISREVSLFVSRIVDVPLMAGYLKPMIFLPVAAVNNLTPDQLEAILLHELAHIKRNDYMENMLQTIIETILFFNPFVWWISKNIRKERENCCDDQVVSSKNPMEYANALVTLEENRLHANPLAMAATANKKQLFYRIKRIMEMKTSNLNLSQKFLALLIVAGTITSIAWLAPGHTAIKPANNTNNGIPERNNPVIARVTNSIAVVNSNIHPVTIKTVKSHSISDTLPHALKKIIIVDSSGNRKEYSSQDEMSPEDSRQLDESISNMHIAMDSSFKNIDWKVQQKNLQKALEEAQRSMAKIDWTKQKIEMEKAMKAAEKNMHNINWEKQRADIEIALKDAKIAMDSSFKNIDWDKMNHNLDISMRQADSAMKNINWDKMNNNLAISMRQADSAMKNINWDKMKLQMKESLAKSNAEIARAGRQWRNSAMVIANGRTIQTNSLVNEMREDNLLKDDKNYKIEMNRDGLYINGKKQSASVYEKYRNMVGNNTSLKLEKHDGRQHTTINIESNTDSTDN